MLDTPTNMNEDHITNQPAPPTKLCKTLMEEVEREAKLSALRDRIGTKVFDWVRPTP